MRRSFLAVVAATLACAAACASLDGLSGAAPDPAPPDAGAESAAPAVDAAVADPCRHLVVPPDPGTDDDPAGDVGSLVLAVRAYSNQGALDGGTPVGFDLDGVCSCFPDPATARGGKPSCVAPAGASPACDGDGGADNQLANLVAAYPALAAPRTGNLPGPTLLLVLNRYNGRANDSEVFLAVLPSPGIFEQRAACTGSMDADAGAPPFAPTWRGCDRWDVDPDVVLPGSVEPITFLRGVVVDHVLLVRSGTKSATFQIGGASFPLTSAVLSARLVAVDDRLVPLQPQPEVGKLFRLEDAVVGGRAAASDLLRATAASLANRGSGPLCDAPELFNAVKKQLICPAADLTRTADQDFTTRACDALSLATSFTAEPARLGEQRGPPAPPCKDPRSPDVQDFFDCAK